MNSASSAASGGRPETAVLLIAALVSIYAISQFLRNSIGVIAGDLSAELGLSATELGLLSSVFFLVFAAAQIPVGIAIDRYGPKRVMLTTSVLAIAGTVLFAVAPSAPVLITARGLMGLGCSTFFMAPLVIYARRFPPERFARLTSLQMGFANLGTLSATAPLAASAALLGWRETFLAVAVLSAAIAVMLGRAVPRDIPVEGKQETWPEALRGVLAALKVRSFRTVFFMHLTTYSCFATVIGLWGGPWLADVRGADTAQKGAILLAGAAAQMAGLFLWGAADRFWRSFRKPVLTGGVSTVFLLAVAATLRLDLWWTTIWFVLFGLSVAVTPILTAHGRSLFPHSLPGRGITLMNVGTIGGVFLSQSVTGLLMDMVGREQGGGYPPDGYRLIFAALAAWMLLSLAFYTRAIDPHPASHAHKA